jgi:hypothetical protein
MGTRATQGTSRATATVIVPTFNAFVVAPIVGSVVLMLVAVGSAAAAFGAFTAFLGYPYPQARRRGQAR